MLGAGAPVSGQAMADELGVTRAALWKQLGALRSRGFLIEGVRGEGYTLKGMPELSAEGIMARMREPRDVIYMDFTESTNDVAMSLAAEGAPHGTVVVADFQTDGRGRQGRPWVSSPGAGLLMSVVLRPRIALEYAAHITNICSLAAVMALRAAAGVEVSLKWPNDLMVGARKLGGLLVEMRSEPGAVRYMVAGLGINVDAARAKLHHAIEDSATSLRMESGRKFSRTDIAVAVLDALEAELELYGAADGPQQLMRRCKALCGTLGRQVTVYGPRGTLGGMAEDIDEYGRLVLRTSDGRTHALSSGDVSMRPPAC